MSLKFASISENKLTLSIKLFLASHSEPMLSCYSNKQTKRFISTSKTAAAIGDTRNVGNAFMHGTNNELY
jgi:hypothetical protein